MTASNTQGALSNEGLADMRVYDSLPKSIREALQETPLRFAALHARHLIKMGVPERQILAMLNEACEDQIKDGKMAPQNWKPIKANPKRRKR